MKSILIVCIVLSLGLAGCSTPAATESPAVTTTAPTVAATQPPTEAPPTAAAATATSDPYGDVTPTAAASTSTPLPAATPAASPTPATVYITYKDFEIAPRQVTIKVGTTVVFLIEAGLLVSHQPYNFTGANQFESPANLGNGASWSYTFKEPGAVTILCGYHAEMIGIVIVEP